MPHKDLEERKRYFREYQNKDGGGYYARYYQENPEYRARKLQLDRERKKRLYKKDPEKMRAKGQADYRKHREKRLLKNRRQMLRSKYGMSLEEYDKLFEEQTDLCAICNETSKSTLHVDHDHDTGVVRGLLCGSCNKALGLFKDDPARIEQAVYYLTKYDRPLLRLVGSAGA